MLLALVIASSLAASLLGPRAMAQELPTLDFSAAGRPLPLENYLNWDPDGSGPAQSAALIASCMDRAGFRWVPDDPTPDTSGDDPVMPGDSGYRLGDGYPDLPASDAEVAVEEPSANAAYLSTLNEAERERWLETLMGGPPRVARKADGTPVAHTFPDSCVGQADERLFGRQDVRLAAQADLATHLEQLRRRIEHDPRLVAAESSWSACMRRLGAPAHNPDDARSAAAAGPHSRAAVATADADHLCRGETGLNGVAEAVFRAYQAPFAATHAELIQAANTGSR